MHKEYALDPDTIASSWETFRRLTEYFGFHEGRVISRFPRKWEEAVLSLTSHFGVMQKHSAVERLVTLRQYGLVNSGREFHQMGSWLKSAWKSHQDQAFWAIISDSKEVTSDSILNSEQCYLDHPAMQVRRNRDVRRIPQELATTARLLLQNSRQIRFVDPYFNPLREKWLKTLKAFLSTGADGGRSSVVAFEYHYCEKESFQPRQPSAEVFRSNCGTWLKSLLPTGSSMVFYRWRERPRGELFHSRYILTERGGLKFDVGLDAGSEGETTPVFLVDSSFAADTLKKFERTATVYELIGPVIRVDSSGQVTEVGD